jgi:hypothetical protein
MPGLSPRKPRRWQITINDDSGSGEQAATMAWSWHRSTTSNLAVSLTAILLVSGIHNNGMELVQRNVQPRRTTHRHELEQQQQQQQTQNTYNLQSTENKIYMKSQIRGRQMSRFRLTLFDYHDSAGGFILFLS